MLGTLYGEADAVLESSLPMGDAVCVTAVDELSAPGAARSAPDT
jgi:hypothetical protein